MYWQTLTWFCFLFCSRVCCRPKIKPTHRVEQLYSHNVSAAKTPPAALHVSTFLFRFAFFLPFLLVYLVFFVCWFGWGFFPFLKFGPSSADTVTCTVDTSLLCANRRRAEGRRDPRSYRWPDFCPFVCIYFSSPLRSLFPSRLHFRDSGAQWRSEKSKVDCESKELPFKFLPLTFLFFHYGTQIPFSRSELCTDFYLSPPPLSLF